MEKRKEGKQWGPTYTPAPGAARDDVRDYATLPTRVPDKYRHMNVHEYVNVSTCVWVSPRFVYRIRSCTASEATRWQLPSHALPENFSGFARAYQKVPNFLSLVSAGLLMRLFHAELTQDQNRDRDSQPITHHNFWMASSSLSGLKRV